MDRNQSSMGFTLIGLTLLSGIAASVIAIRMLARGRGIVGQRQVPSRTPGREEIAVSLLEHVLVAGGMESAVAATTVRQHLGSGAASTHEIDLPSWSERFAVVSSPAQRLELLETAVDLAGAQYRTIPVAQYGALLDLCFGLGFQTDRLSRALSNRGVGWSDYSSGRSSPPRVENSRRESLAKLGLSEGASRREVTSAYRRMAARYHPDRLHDASDSKRQEAAVHFIEITEAYETLLHSHSIDS